jgi:class 3 adenylate cyclase
MADIATWLDSLGLAEHEPSFRENGVDEALLPELTNEDLKDLGVARLADRKHLLKAIAALDSGGGDDEAPEPTTRGEAERRLPTVMFCDLVGSTELSRRLDPEDLRDLMRRYQDAVSGAVARYGGHIAKYLGDGVLAYFGWPQAYEDQAERAVRAGLEAVAAVTGLHLDDGNALAARVGIATGQVVVGDLVGEGGRDAEAVTGETPNLAARLQGVAAPGQVLVGTATHGLLDQAFQLDDLGAQDLKGFGEAVQAWGVVGERALESRFEASHGAALTRLVGRQSELALLLERWELAKGAEGQCVLIVGEAGIGKSRLTEALQQNIAGETFFRIHIQASPHHTNTPLYGTIQNLQRTAGFAAVDDTTTRLDKLQA